MKNFWAKVNLKEETALDLIRAFYKDFNSESSIYIKGQVAEIKFFFEEPPMEIIKAIEKCDDIELRYNEEEEKSNTILEIPELMEIATKADSYENFADHVIKWLGIDKKHDLCVNVLLAATRVKKIAWKNIDEDLASKGMCLSLYDRNCFNKQISEKFENRKQNITILTFIKEVAKFKTFDFQKKSAEEKPEGIAQNVEENSKLVLATEFMPEIPEFEDVIKTVDKTKPIHERVKHVLSAMGWDDNENNKDHQTIFKITNEAIRLKEMNMHIICSKCNIAPETIPEIRMIFVTFINNFVGKYQPDKKVRFSDFLKELQSKIMLENEIE